jgi:hypothetical protein
MRALRTLLLTFGIAAAIGGATFAAPANAEVTGKFVELSQEDFDVNGDPELVANGIPEGGKPILWQQCDELFTVCSDYATKSDVLEPGETIPGQAFTVRLASRPTGEVLHSHTWLGRPTAQSPPSLLGMPMTGTRVRPVASQWSGGWGSEYDRLYVYACRTPDAKLCDVITEVEDSSRPPIRGGMIGAYYEGWGLYVVDFRTPEDAAFTLIGYGPRRPNPALKPDQTKSISEYLGPIAGRDDYGATVPKYLKTGRRSATVAHVHCPRTCRATAGFSEVGPNAIYGYPFVFAQSKPTRIQGFGAIHVARHSLRKGKLVRVSVRINGVLAASELARVG